MNIKINPPAPTPAPTKKYPYWAVNSGGDLFYIVAPETAMWISPNCTWKNTLGISESALTPLAPGTKIEITV